jgi:Protein of unknown function (DUF3108)
LLDIARVAVGALALSILPHGAQAQDRLVAGYAIDWEGLHIGAFEAELVTAPGRYQLSYEARTEGLIGWLFPFVSQGWSRGTRTAGQIMPERFEGDSAWRDEHRTWTVAFDADGRVTQVEVPEEDRQDREPVPAALQVAPDPLALALDAILAAAPGVRRTGTSFDGRRAIGFALDCAPDMVAFTDANPGAAAAADQEALACTVAGELAAGASRRWRDHDDADEKREPATVWLREGIVGGSLWPVRVVGESRYGTVTVQLVELERDDPPPSQ